MIIAAVLLEAWALLAIVAALVLCVPQERSHKRQDVNAFYRWTNRMLASCYVAVALMGASLICFTLYHLEVLT